MAKRSGVDPELDPAARAAAVESSGPRAGGRGTQAPRASDAQESQILAQLEQKHGTATEEAPPARGRGRARANGHDSAREEREQRTTFNPTKPLTWTKEQRQQGDVIRDADGRFKRWIEGEADEVRTASAAQDEGEIDDDEPKLEGEGDDDEHPAETHRGDDREDRGARLQAALRALRRDGWTDSELDGLTDDALIRVGEKRVRGQDAIDRKLDERSRKLGRGGRQQESAEAGAKGRASPTQGDPQPNATLDAALAEYQQTILDAYADEDLATKSSAALRKVIAAAADRGEPEESGHDSSLLDQLMDERMRQRLGERFPKLLTSERLWDKLSTRAAAWYEAGVENGSFERGLRGLDAAFNDTARALSDELGPQATRKERVARERAESARENGGFSRVRTETRQPYEGVNSRDDLETLWLKAREAGDTREQRAIEERMRKVPRART